MKNWLPFVFGPAFAMERTPGLSWRRLGMELVGEPVAGAAASASRRVAALRHESGDHAVEGRAVEVAVPREEDEVVYGPGRFRREQADLERAAAFHLESGGVGLVRVDAHGGRA